MVDTMGKPKPSKPPVSLSMYKSSYKKDYQWCEERKLPSDIQKLQVADAQLKAKEFAVPQERPVIPYSDSVVAQREVIPALSIETITHADAAQERMPDSSRALQEGKHLASPLPAAESYLPKHDPASQLAEKAEGLQALSEMENELSCCQHLPVAAQAAGTTGMLLPRQKLVPTWGTYQQFLMETSQERQNNGLQIKLRNLGSSVLAEDCSDHDWRTTYNTDFKHRPGACGGHCKGHKNLSHIFPKDALHKNHWVSEYNDAYSISSRRLRWSPEIPAMGLCSGKGIEMDAASDGCCG
ncbi:uncharacterized protein [Melopsittacus undulatus]|uniref:uncharacterized protein n=1 Tax=Melopsittacus undulatus TaxID=13146 RepID=UPI00146A8FD4|nr:uncharacterized protein LOC115945760 [Melopsittacus undulatus]XP_033920725.1 uncharacterized protein LOC115945760 [Melopsittacus undulatus]